MSGAARVQQARGERSRRVLAALVIALPFVAVGVTSRMWVPSLPGRVAFHWDASGQVDGTIDAGPLSLLALAASAAALAAGLIALGWPRLSASARRAAAFWTGSAAGVAGAGWLVPAGLTLQAGSAGDAELGGWILALMASAFYGALPFLLLPAPKPQRPEPVEPLELGEGESGAYSRTTSAPSLVAVALAIAAAAVVTALVTARSGEWSGGSTIGIAVMAFAVLAVASFAIVRVTVDWRGLRVVSLLARVPLLTVPLERVLHTEVAELRAADWGGLGRRSKPGGTAVLLRSGAGMLVTAEGGHRYAVSVDRPEAPAALLSALARAARGSSRDCT